MTPAQYKGRVSASASPAPELVDGVPVLCIGVDPLSLSEGVQGLVQITPGLAQLATN